MTIIHNTNTVSTTIGEWKEISRLIYIEFGENEDTQINIEIDDKGNGIVSTPHPFKDNENV